MLPAFIRVLRPQQWYKNLLIFLPLIFVGDLFSFADMTIVLMGFISLCLCSSYNYILNDYIDRERDREHPEKKTRPLVSGALSPSFALVEALILLVAGLALAFFLNTIFGYAVVFLVALTKAYTLFFKHIPFADILSVSINFVVRAVSGTLLLNIQISPWLIICTFFLALFLLAGKRYGDLQFLGNKATAHKETLMVYTKDVTSALMIIATSLIILAYTAYTFFSNHQGLIISLPFALFVFFRYFSLVYTGSPIARHPEKVFHDKQMVISMILWTITVIAALYI